MPTVAGDTRGAVKHTGSRALRQEFRRIRGGQRTHAGKKEAVQYRAPSFVCCALLNLFWDLVYV